MNAPSEERLMRYFDGELDADEAREVEAFLESSPEAKLSLLAWDRVGDAVRAIGEDAGAPGVDIADAVMSRIGQPSKVAGASAARARASRRWMAAVPAIGLSIAAAAAIALYLRPPVTSPSAVGMPSVAREASEAPTAGVETSPSAFAAAAETGSGAAIESVDFGAIAGTIFMVPNGQSPEESETPVVWLMDDADSDEGRMAPL